MIVLIIAVRASEEVVQFKAQLKILFIVAEFFSLAKAITFIAFLLIAPVSQSRLIYPV